MTTPSTSAQGPVALLPCPFCGSEAEIERCGDRHRSTIYRCTSCACSLETGEEWSHGRRWNERASPPPAASDASPSGVLDLYREAVRVDVKMEGPQFMGCNASALKRAWEADRASLASDATPAPTSGSEAGGFDICSDCGGAGESPDGCLCRQCGGGGRVLAKAASSPAGGDVREAHALKTLMKAIQRAEDGAGTLPAKEAVKLRPADWHAVCDRARKLAALSQSTSAGRVGA